LSPHEATTGKSSVWGVSPAKKERPMPEKTNDTIIATVMEQLMVEGPQAMAQIISALMNLAMRMEREQFLGAGHYERAPERRGYANGTKLKLIDTLAATLSLEVPKTTGTDEPYYPQALERGPGPISRVGACFARSSSGATPVAIRR
jgi:hypothetical protein